MQAKYTFEEARRELCKLHEANTQLLQENAEGQLSNNDLYAHFGANLTRMRQIWLKTDWGTLV